MSGTPSEADIQVQWKAAANILEKTRAYADGTVAGAGNLFDVLEQSLEGEFLPAALAGSVSRYRANLSTLVSPALAREMLSPVLFEYRPYMTDGGGYNDLGRLAEAFYEHMVTNGDYVTTRAITYDTTSTAGGSNVGDGDISRLTVDENGFDLEACTVERKRFRCRADQNSGTNEHSETLEMLGEPGGLDSLLRTDFGSGEATRTFLRCRHAGSGQGGSLLRNSSFSTYDATNGFSGWTKASGTAPTQDTTTTYRGSAGSTTAAAMKTSAAVLMKQTLSSMSISRIDTTRPYFFRVMVNGTAGSASGGEIVIRMGSQETTTTVDSIVAAGGWQEVKIAIGTGCWPANFNEDTFDVEIESTSTTGTILFDDAIFTDWDYIDGTYWLPIGGTTAFLVDDVLTFTDTGGAAGTGILQWWWWLAGFGHLPNSGTTQITDPT